MTLQQIDLAAPYTPVAWLVDGLIPLGCVTFVAALPGAGKTTLMTALMWAMSAERPGTFLDRAVCPGASIYVNHDSATGDGRAVRHILEPLQVADPSGRQGQLTILEPGEGSYGIDEADLAQIRHLALERSAQLIVFDSFMACFPGVNSNRLQEVLVPMKALHELAVATGAAVVVIDHLPKPVSGERVGARGVMGSIGKEAQARAVYLLDAVDTEESGGRHVIRWRVRKNNLGVVPKPFVVECIHVDGGLVLAVGSAEEVLSETRTARARLLVREELEQAGEAWTARKTLVALAQGEAGLGQTAAKGVVDEVIAQLGAAVEQRTLPKAGSPLEYRLTPTD